MPLIDLDNDFYLVKMAKEPDYEFALTGGPWVIADHYLAVRPWSPNFVLDEAAIYKIAAWLRFPGLSIEYFNPDFLEKKLGVHFGRVLRVDATTSLA